MITKQELIEEISRLKEKIVKQGDIDATVILKDNAIRRQQELEKEVELLKEQIVNQGDIQATIDLKDKAIKAEYDLRKQFDLLKEELKTRDKQINSLGDRLNKISALLEEYIVSYEESHKMNEIWVKTSAFAKDALRKKIEDYNKGD
jgi:Mg2+ and Co2+ transporter CorA